MVHVLTSLGPDLAEGFDSIIDVRSPLEFAEDHIPGAINLPAFSDEERARVGTIYVQQSPFLARKVGAAILARNVAHHLETALAAKEGGWRPMVYCWRGGQRSGGVETILSQIGWRAARIEGGYQSYRRMVVKLLYETDVAHRFVLIDGNTGTGKTAILQEIASQGGQMLDLEGLAEHRGSLLGGMIGDQPSQKMFESRLAGALTALDPARPVFVEAESSKIGARLIPARVWKAMQAAQRVQIEVPLAARAAFLVDQYQDVWRDSAVLRARLDKLRPHCGNELVGYWLDLYQGGALETLAHSLMAEHYDAAYARSRRSHVFETRATLGASALGGRDIAGLATRVLGLFDEGDARLIG